MNVLGPAVIISGEMLRTLFAVLHTAMRTRARNGLPISGHQQQLLEAVTAALAATGQSDSPDGSAAQDVPRELPTITVAEAAITLGVSERTVRRLAPKLGGQQIGGRWFIDDQALREHQEGIWTGVTQ